MGIPKYHDKTALVIPVLFSDESLFHKALVRLTGLYGQTHFISEPTLFNKTAYYTGEMGKGINRCYLFFEGLIEPEELVDIKLTTNTVEQELAVNGMRRVNLDPCYVALGKVVIVSTKDASYRVYMGKGIYAQGLYFYKDNTFQPYEWTYPDYKDDTAVSFFNTVRKEYKVQLRPPENGCGSG